MALRKTQFWFDNAAGVLTEETANLNSVQMSLSKEVLDDTGLNDDYVQHVSIGLVDGSFAISGYVRNINTGIIKSLQASLTTSLSKTAQWKMGSQYFNAETAPDGLQVGGADGRGLIPFSCNLLTDGTVNRTSVALT